MPITELLGVLAFGVSIVTGWLLRLQLRQSDRFKAAEFIHSLEGELTTQHETEQFLIEWSQGKNSGDALKVGQLMTYVGFFERVSMLLDSKVVTMDQVDRLFALRFFLTCNSTYTQDKVLLNPMYAGYFTSLFVLHDRWVRFRRTQGLEIPFEETSLAKTDPEFYKRQILKNRAMARVTLVQKTSESQVASRDTVLASD